MPTFDNNDEILNDEVEEVPATPTPVRNATPARNATPVPEVKEPTFNNAEAERRRKRNLGF